MSDSKEVVPVQTWFTKAFSTKGKAGWDKDVLLAMREIADPNIPAYVKAAAQQDLLSLIRTLERTDRDVWAAQAEEPLVYLSSFQVSRDIIERSFARYTNQIGKPNGQTQQAQVQAPKAAQSNTTVASSSPNRGWWARHFGGS